MIEWAGHTIKWQRTGPSRRWKQFYHPQWSKRSRYDRAPKTINQAIHLRLGEVDFGSWIGDPNQELAVRKELLENFKKIVDRSLDEIERSAIDSGLFEERRRRARRGAKMSGIHQRSRNEAFLWLAGYQTCAWSRIRLAEAVNVERNAVGMRIKEPGSLAPVRR